MHENNGLIDDHHCPSNTNWSLGDFEYAFTGKDFPVIFECKCNDKEELRNLLMLIDEKGIIKGSNAIS